MTTRNKKNKPSFWTQKAKLVILCFSVLLFNGCANESVPQGGEQDKIPPKSINSSPANKSLKFNSDKIQIIFDEFLKPTGFAKTLISPPLEKKPDFHIEGKKLTVKLKSQLRDSTTYTLNFADDIKDLNEGNTLNNFTYVFSTGSYIDSQTISGSVSSAKDNSPLSDVIVSLYPEDSTDGVTHTKPYYFAITDKSGHYQINNIKSGNYLLFGLKDQNNNYEYDQPNELIAFEKQPVVLTDSNISNQNLRLFSENTKKLKISEARSVEPGKLMFAFSKPIINFKLDWGGYSKNDFAWIYPTNDTVIYWYSNNYISKDSFFITVNDTLLDTLILKLKSIDKDSIEKEKNKSFIVENQSIRKEISLNKEEKNSQISLYQSYKINFALPIIEINPAASIQIMEDTTKQSLTPKLTMDEKTKQTATIDFLKKEKTTYTLTIQDSAFKNIFGFWNKKIVQHLVTDKKDNYGNLNITLKTQNPEKYYIIQLLNASNEPVKEFFFTGNGERRVVAENVPSGMYKFVVVEDDNRNGKWDTGSFINKIQPEKIFTYKDTYQLKGGWDLDVEVKF